MTDVQIFTTGGTIDKVYFDALSEFQVGESPLDAILREANVGIEYALTSLMKKDSLELTDEDRDTILTAVSESPSQHILITHGTDTMALTAERLRSVSGKTIVLTGSMQPARLRSTDAIFNVGFAIATALQQAPGVYIAMNGQVFAAGEVKKDRAAGRFVLND
ncbi:MAG: asparaginase domain-containing protein [Pseudomonadota bacterium]